MIICPARILVGKYVISAYDVWHIPAHRFAISVPNLVCDPGFILGTKFTLQCVMMRIASPIVNYDGNTILAPANFAVAIVYTIRPYTP